jgi:hypothetical protein
VEKNTINTEFADVFKLRTKKQAISILKFLKTIASNHETLIIKKLLQEPTIEKTN